ncbi:MAG: undecaprenyl-phosphate galactose phosphotransferase WbaP [Planctomycetes bacterium]|nr:undecaprenyl-phosphate galactose phosphotransferase WbaP [Planctomycetota bacterium]
MKYSNRKHNLSSLRLHYARLWMDLLLGLADLLALLLSSYLAVELRWLIGGRYYDPSTYFGLEPVIPVFLMVYLLSGVYPGIGLNPVEELRRLSVSTSTVFLFLTALTFGLQILVEYSRLVFGFFWVLALVLVPFFRWGMRRSALRVHAWGEPVAVIGNGSQTQKVVKFLDANQAFGLTPVLLIDGFDQPAELTVDICRCTIEDLIADPSRLGGAHISTLVMVPTEVPIHYQKMLVNETRFGLHRLVLISDLGWVGGSAVTLYDLQGVLGLEVQRNLLNPFQRFLKRGLDLAFVIVGGLLILPVMALIAVWVAFESPGDAFYGHTRIGQDGKRIKIWKFRSMVYNADQILVDYLDNNPENRAEWEVSYKLKNDLRLTRSGKFLRKTSLDELPQLWNVLKGEMSLVGPRPIVDDEARHYEEIFQLYTQVLPGMTGLWQVSGRSDTSYDTRIRLDEYYIRHWSIWLDIYILILTVWVVLKRSGAY